MRDIVVTLIVLGSLPFILKRPWLGALMWVWLGVMNPHRLSWGFAYNFPFAQLVAIATLISLFIAQRRGRFVWTAPTIFLLLFILWMSVSTIFALLPENIFDAWSKVMKIMLMVFVVMIALHERKHVEWLVWTLVISLGFYGVKGGIFTITGGGENRVFGPATTFIEENNTLAIALLMTIPLIWYLRMYATNKWLRLGLLGSVVLCSAAALGSYSRGAMVTIVPMMLFLWLKSRQKLTLAIVMIAAAPILIGVMPERWFSRMETINTYEEDTSSMGRINAWETAFNLAKDRPLIGGGFHIYDAKVFAKYSPNPEDVHAAHSIYFAALGEHGWVGLLLFLLCGFSTWRTASWIIRHAKDRPELRRDADLAMMIQVSLIAYSVGGAFLSLLYFDVPYYLIIILVLMRENIENLEKAEKLNLANQTSGRAKASSLAGALPVDVRSSDSVARTLKP